MRAPVAALVVSVLVVASCRPARIVPGPGGGAYFTELEAPLRDAPHGRVVGRTSCGARYDLLERRDGATRIRYHPEEVDGPGLARGSEIGWVEDADLAAATRCIGPSVWVWGESERDVRTLVPPTLASADLRIVAPRLPPRVYRIVEDDEGRACVASRFDGTNLVEGEDLTGEHVVSTWGVDRSDDRPPTELRLTGPSMQRFDAEGKKVGPESSWLCLRHVAVVQRGPEAWVLVPVLSKPEAKSVELAGFATRVAEPWYTSAAACERDAAKRAPIVTAATRAGRHPERHGCW